MKWRILFIITISIISLETAFNQEVYKLNIKQPAPLSITISESVSGTIGEVINLDTWFQVEGETSYSREWKFRAGSLMQTLDSPIYTITSDGVFYLTITNDNGCTIRDSITLNILTNIEDITFGHANRQLIKVYPNPNTGEFEIFISDCQPGYFIQIINSTGILILSKMLDCNNNEFQEKIKMPVIESGIYYLILKQANRLIYRQKVIILK
jgi:hypothetical protein